MTRQPTTSTLSDSRGVDHFELSGGSETFRFRGERRDLRRRIEYHVGRSLERHQDSLAGLSTGWRAGVGELRGLMHAARELLDRIEAEHGAETLRRDPRLVRQICDLVFDQLWSTYRGHLRALEASSGHFGPDLRERAASYVAAELMPLLEPCPIHRRAYEKPRGYAGDYRLMELIDDERLSGDSLYGCFLQRVVQRFELGQAVVARGLTARRKIAEVVARGEGPCRILSLASGPALELRRFRECEGEVGRPLELLLVDQDEEALARAHAALSAAIAARSDAHRIELTCLHFSVRQLLAPSTPAETRLVDETLAGVDLVYSMGLFDYLSDAVAARLLRSLYRLLAPGGELFVGNLVRVPDCSWLMDYAVHWRLIYREEADMLALAERTRLPASADGVTTDETGRCLFLNLERPQEGVRAAAASC